MFEEDVAEKIASDECFSLKDLKIDGYDVMNAGIPQWKFVEQILDDILEMVLDGKIKNEKEELIKVAVKMKNNV
ncbi:hypothetical protein HMPREF9225_0640 [Peptoniphilus duerdenii ATCC BAA-1640]|uniref:CCA-adding enzyme C-terminal domain-containing protein n=1 Tax=Peptoniphilus duerdenii ATCC BAA-1640 TaxID=862517 RepID=E0NKF1_9FIRM|nr:poly(A) polymerase [Peptoniphilus duerdenii]EFM25758.1 hypothetical protein HMPREF9225_0640 [Peptoniphilus duerdenii ATCC BAA-1640]